MKIATTIALLSFSLTGCLPIILVSASKGYTVVTVDVAYDPVTQSRIRMHTSIFATDQSSCSTKDPETAKRSTSMFGHLFTAQGLGNVTSIGMPKKKDVGFEPLPFVERVFTGERPVALYFDGYDFTVDAPAPAATGAPRLPSTRYVCTAHSVAFIPVPGKDYVARLSGCSIVVDEINASGEFVPPGHVELFIAPHC